MQSRTKYRRAIRANNQQGRAGYRSIPLFSYILLVKHRATVRVAMYLRVAMYRCYGKLRRTRKFVTSLNGHTLNVRETAVPIVACALVAYTLYSKPRSRATCEAHHGQVAVFSLQVQ